MIFPLLVCLDKIYVAWFLVVLSAWLDDV